MLYSTMIRAPKSLVYAKSSLPDPDVSRCITSLCKRTEGFIHKNNKNCRTSRHLASFYKEEYEEDYSTIDYESPSTLSYVDGVEMPITSKLRITTPRDDIPNGIWPVFRILDENGCLRSNQDQPDVRTFSELATQEASIVPTDKHSAWFSTLRRRLLERYPEQQSFICDTELFQPSQIGYTDVPDESSRNTLLRCHRTIIRLREMDDILLNAQRQGRISFYLTCRGEEAMTIGSASALESSDVLLTQYREQGLFMWRGFTLEQFTNQCMGNDLDLGLGRQMPIHYGSRALNIHTVSSTLGTQIPQAVGVAYKMKLDFLSGKAKHASLSAVYFGDGAASTGDFHSACNFAATLKVPVIFFCRNNGYAISTPIREQYASDGIVCRGKGYGMAAIRVDGNDVFAVHEATKAARAYALKNMEPVLIEAISYRQAHHSTSDDSFSYRVKEEVEDVQRKYDPLTRLNAFLLDHGCIEDDEEFNAITKDERSSVLAALKSAESRPGMKLETMFKDIFYEMPQSLKNQEKTLLEHMQTYPDHYSKI